MPVAVGVVTFGVGDRLGRGGSGRCRRGLAGVRPRGRRPRPRARSAGAAFTLAPPAGTLSVLLGLAVLAIGRVAGRDARTAAVATGIGTFPVLFLSSPSRTSRWLAAILVLTLVAIVRLVTIRATAAAGPRCGNAPHSRRAGRFHRRLVRSGAVRCGVRGPWSPSTPGTARDGH